jgi:histone H1/5
MVTKAIINMDVKEGVSRQKIKKYIHANYKGLPKDADAKILKAIKDGVEQNIFLAKEATSGPVKMSNGKPNPSPKPKAAVKVAIAKKKAASPIKKSPVKRAGPTKRIVKSPAKKSPIANKKSPSPKKTGRKSVVESATSVVSPTSPKSSPVEKSSVKKAPVKKQQSRNHRGRK